MGDSVHIWVGESGLRPRVGGLGRLDAADDRRTVTEKAEVCGDSGLGAFDLTASGLTSELPGQFADLSQGLSRDGFAETREAATGIDGDPSTEGGVAIAQELFGIALRDTRPMFSHQSSSSAEERS